MVDIARLRPGQAVLIQAGASTVNQFAVQIAQRLTAATIFLTVRNEEERLDMESLGVNSKNILEESDSDLELAISDLCNGKWLSMAIHQASNHTLLPRLLRCMTASDVLVDLDVENATKIDSSGDEPVLSVALFRRAMYTAYNTSQLLHNDPSHMSEILKQVSKVQLDQSLRSPSPRNFWPASQSIEAI